MLDYLDDLEADFLAIYRVENMMQLPSAKFFRLAERLPAFKGVMQARVMEQNEEVKKVTEATSTRSAPSTTNGTQQRHNLRERGGDAVAVPNGRASYLADKLKEARS